MHPEVLTKEGAELFPLLKRFSGYYLAGGTSLALQLGHRISFDFDLFRDAHIPRSLLGRVEYIVGKPVVPLVNNSDELTVTVDGVKLTFLNYPFRPAEPLEVYDGLPLLSITDIAATKAYTIGRRGSYRDYIDLYFVIHDGRVTLHEIISTAERKFGEAFNGALFLQQLVYLDDIKDRHIQFLKHPITPDELLSFFEGRIRQAAEQDLI